MKWFHQLVLSVIFGLALSLAFLEHSYFLLSWIAFVPLLFAIKDASYLRIYLLTIFGSFVAFSTGKYWIIDFILISKGATDLTSLSLAVLYWVYCAHMFAFALLMSSWLERKDERLHMLALPVTATTFIAAFPLLFTMHLGETQVYFTSALQAIEFTGVHGLNFVILLSNVLIFRLLSCLRAEANWRRSIKSAFRSGQNISCSLVIVAWLGYGLLSLQSWQADMLDWDALKVGLVQPNETPRLGKKTVHAGYADSYLPEMEMSERLASLQLDLIVWPESQYKGYFDKTALAFSYQQSVASFSTPLLLQDFENVNNAQYNSAVYIDANGKQQAVYRKIKRIPFGEYLPLIGNNTTLRKSVNTYLGEFLNELSPGDDFVSMSHPKASLIPLICYETTFPSFVANAVDTSNTDSNKTKILVALSNDGWFGSTHQPRQHITVSALRAVENRVPLIHVANNGPSIIVAPSGEIVFESDFQVAGGYIAEVGYSESLQGSFYSRYPNAFIYLIYLLLAGMVVKAITVKTHR